MKDCYLFYVIKSFSVSGNNYLRDNITKQALLQKVRQLNEHYSVICDIVRESTEADGVTMILIIIYFFMYLENNTFFVIFWKIFTPCNYWTTIINANCEVCACVCFLGERACVLACVHVLR